jgi:S1-C subfamily serine protease
MVTTETPIQPQQMKHHHYGTIALIAIITVAFLVGSYYIYTLYRNEKTTLESEIGTLNVQLDALKEQMKNQSQVVFTNISLTHLYNNIKNSVVMIRGLITHTSFFTQTITEVQGSGFVYNYTKTLRMVIITNNHVVDGVSDISVTFTNGTAYSANVLGRDVYADLAVLEVTNAPAKQFQPLNITYSSTLEVGDPVIAIGNPFGLTGSMTTGTVSQLGRTITENTTGGYAIANIIQFDAPINPGNSGGPLLNSRGQVVGITTAIVTNSQGLGFAIPSNAILREVAWLIESGAYQLHSWLGVQGTDMDYYIANAMHTDITYGWLVTAVVSGGPADTILNGGTREVQIGGSTIPIGGDIIVAMNGTSITNGDNLSAYLEERTQPNNILVLTIKRDVVSSLLNVSITLGARP